MSHLFILLLALPGFQEGEPLPTGSLPRLPEVVEEAAAPARQTSQTWDARAVEHLYNRAGFGARPAEIASGVRIGREAFVDLMIDGFGSDPEPFFVREFRRRPYDREANMALTDEERNRLKAEYRRENKRQMVEYTAWWIDAMRSGAQPLRERMTLFWHGFFTSSIRDVKSSVMMIRQNELLREHALGSYGDLLYGIVRDPAMLKYLNNDQNRRGKPNENLARELMELFSLGEGNYTEEDVKEAARALTGWDVLGNRFTVAKRHHDRGRKTVLGRTGRLGGDDLPGILLSQEACARWVAVNLITYFEGLEPDEERLDGYAVFLRSNDYRIDAFLRRLFNDPAFYRDEVVGNRIAGPIDYLVGHARRLGVRPPPVALASGSSVLGQRLFDPPNVKGWDEGEAWITTSTFLLRGNLAGILVGAVTPSDLTRAEPLELMEPALAMVEVDSDQPDTGADGEMVAQTPPVRPVPPVPPVQRRSPELEALRVLERFGWQPRIHLRARCERVGAESDAEVVAYLCDALLAVPVSEEAQAPLVEFLSSERAKLELEPDMGRTLAHPASARRRLRRFYTPATGEEFVLRRLAHVILSLPEAQLN